MTLRAFLRSEPGAWRGLSAAERCSRLGAGLLWPVAMAASPWMLQSAVGPGCLFRAATGLPCPLCGGTHACAALVQGEWGAAWQANPGAVGLLVALTLLALQWVAEGGAGRQRVRPWPWSGAGALRWVAGSLLVSWMARLAGWL